MKYCSNYKNGSCARGELAETLTFTEVEWFARATHGWLAHPGRGIGPGAFWDQDTWCEVSGREDANY